jgi:translocation and assembly module TamB
MVTGKLTVDAQLPRIAIAGKVVADAGWFDLDMLGGIPTVDGDVVVIRPGEEKKVSVPAEISLDLNVDLGPRFYLTGYGVNSGLVGDIHIMMVGGKLTAEGALRTRGGAIEVYGQRLQLRRGTITFQGDIASPVLNIEALRTGVAVQAGVRVAGTARRPRIDLVSYPDVNDVEKLSWLLLGHGADSGGGDAALLFSVGTSLLGSGAPFYREFGLDELSIQSGALGSTGSILPVESVVSSLNSGTSDIERKFIVASKKLASGITLSIEQALSDTGTVARASYRIARGLTAEISAGTVSGIALVYRTFFNE